MRDRVGGAIEALLALLSPKLGEDCRLSTVSDASLVRPCALSHALSNCWFWMAHFHLLASLASAAIASSMRPLALISSARSLQEIEAIKLRPTAERLSKREWARSWASARAHT